MVNYKLLSYKMAKIANFILKKLINKYIKYIEFNK